MQEEKINIDLKCHSYHALLQSHIPFRKPQVHTCFTCATSFSSSDSSADTAESFWVLLGWVEPPQVAVVMSALIILTPNPSSMSPLLPLLTEYVPPSDKSSSPDFFRFSRNFCFLFFSFSSCSSLWRLSSDHTNELGRAVIKFTWILDSFANDFVFFFLQDFYYISLSLHPYVVWMDIFITILQ